MPPKLLSDDKQNILIRPLAYVAEKDIIKYTNYKKFPIIPCNLCGSQENLQRAMINDMLRQWDNEHPKRLAGMFKALQNVAPSRLADRQLFDFESLTRTMDDSVRLFEGDNIQVGQANLLNEMGLPTNPQVQRFNPKFNPSDSNNTDVNDTTAAHAAPSNPILGDNALSHESSADNKPKIHKIPIINPLVWE